VTGCVAIMWQEVVINVFGLHYLLESVLIKVKYGICGHGELFFENCLNFERVLC